MQTWLMNRVTQVHCDRVSQHHRGRCNRCRGRLHVRCLDSCRAPPVVTHLGVGVVVLARPAVAVADVVLAHLAIMLLA